MMGLASFRGRKQRIRSKNYVYYCFCKSGNNTASIFPHGTNYTTFGSYEKAFEKRVGVRVTHLADNQLAPHQQDRIITLLVCRLLKLHI